DDQFGEPREVISIGVRTKRNAPIAHLAEPVELPVESEVLENPEEAHQKAQAQDEPYEAAPIFESAKQLGSEKEEKGIGNEQLQFQARGIRRSGGVKKPLSDSHQRKCHQGRQEAGNDEMFLLSVKRAN